MPHLLPATDIRRSCVEGLSIKPLNASPRSDTYSLGFICHPSRISRSRRSILLFQVSSLRRLSPRTLTPRSNAMHSCLTARIVPRHTTMHNSSLPFPNHSCPSPGPATSMSNSTRATSLQGGTCTRTSPGGRRCCSIGRRGARRLWNLLGPIRRCSNDARPFLSHPNES